MAELIDDVLSVLQDLGAGRATIIGHDWGGVLGWWVAMLHPRVVERLAVLAAAHPLCYLAARNAGELNYAQDVLDQLVAARPGAPFDVDRFSAWVTDREARAELAAALRRSDPECIRNYYRANLMQGGIVREVPSIQAPVLVLYGVNDTIIPPRYYDLSAGHVTGPCEIVAIPRAGHFIHHAAAERVTSELLRWLGECGGGAPSP